MKRAKSKSPSANFANWMFYKLRFNSCYLVGSGPILVVFEINVPI